MYIISRLLLKNVKAISGLKNDSLGKLFTIIITLIIIMITELNNIKIYIRLFKLIIVVIMLIHYQLLNYELLASYFKL